MARLIPALPLVMLDGQVNSMAFYKTLVMLDDHGINLAINLAIKHYRCLIEGHGINLAIKHYQCLIEGHGINLAIKHHQYFVY